MTLSTEKLRNLILFIGAHTKVSQLGLTKLYKLIYFSDVLALRDLDHSITGSDYIKYEHGPVPSRGEKSIKQLRKDGCIESKLIDLDNSTQMNRIKSCAMANTKVFTEGELAIVDRVCSDFGKLTASALSELSHKEPAWVAAKMLDKLSPSLMLYGSQEDPEGL